MEFTLSNFATPTQKTRKQSKGFTMEFTLSNFATPTYALIVKLDLTWIFQKGECPENSRENSNTLS